MTAKLEYKYDESEKGRQCEIWVDNFRICTVTERVPYNAPRIIIHLSGVFSIPEMKNVMSAHQAAMRVADFWEKNPKNHLA